MDTIVVFSPAPGPSSSFSITNTANPTYATNGNSAPPDSVTFSSVNVGTATADREVYVAVATVGVLEALGGITSVTIGGNAATEVVKSADASDGGTRVASAGIYKYNLTTGTTADIVVNCDERYQNVLISVYDVKGRTTEATASNTATTGTSVAANVNTQAGGAVIVAMGQDTTNSTSDLTPTGFTGDNESLLDPSDVSQAAICGSASGLSAETPRSISVSSNTSGSFYAAAIASVAIS